MGSPRRTKKKICFIPSSVLAPSSKARSSLSLSVILHQKEHLFRSVGFISLLHLCLFLQLDTQHVLLSSFVPVLGSIGHDVLPLPATGLKNARHIHLLVPHKNATCRRFLTQSKLFNRIDLLRIKTIRHGFPLRMHEHASTYWVTLCQSSIYVIIGLEAITIWLESEPKNKCIYTCVVRGHRISQLSGKRDLGAAFFIWPRSDGLQTCLNLMFHPVLNTPKCLCSRSAPRESVGPT